MSPLLYQLSYEPMCAQVYRGACAARCFAEDNVPPVLGWATGGAESDVEVRPLTSSSV